MKTKKEIRMAFWESFPHHKSERRTNKTQNDYCTNIRCDFVEYVEFLRRSGIISEKLANRVTL
jgi:hypothetical protein